MVVVVAEDVAVQVDDVAKHIMEVANPITEAEAEAEAGAEEGVVPVVGKGNRMFNATTAEFGATMNVIVTELETILPPMQIFCGTSPWPEIRTTPCTLNEKAK